MSANQDPDFNARRNNISQLLVVHVCRRDTEGDRAGRKAVLLLRHTPSIGLTLERASHDTSLHGGIHVFATWRANGNTTINFQLCTAAFYYHHAKTQGIASNCAIKEATGRDLSTLDWMAMDDQGIMMMWMAVDED